MYRILQVPPHSENAENNVFPEQEEQEPEEETEMLEKRKQTPRVECLQGFPGSLAGKASACNAGDPGSIPGLGRSPGEGIGYLLQYSWASLLAQTLKNLPAMWETWVQSLGWEDSMEEGMAIHSSILAWRIPMNRGSWWATVHGVTKSLTQLKQLSMHTSSDIQGFRTQSNES